MDKAEVVGRIREFARRTSVQPDDVLVTDVMRQLPCKSLATARKWMAAFASANMDEFELLKLADGKGHKVLVLRSLKR